jgi:gliding motility-associated-like protein
VQVISPQKIILINDGDATAADFLGIIQNMLYEDTNPNPRSGIRRIELVLYNECEAQVAKRTAFLPIFPPEVAGADGDTVMCYYAEPLVLKDILVGADPSGYWEPALSNGNFFDPKLDSAGVYAYITTGSECKGDTAYARVTIEYPFELGEDTTLCYGDIRRLELPKGYVIKDWEWSDGSRLKRLDIDAPGVYGLRISTEYCSFEDSLPTHFFTCTECPAYAPNVFSPNDDGKNDGWRLYLTCLPDDYRLEIYDRWGSLVFRTTDPMADWNGQVRGRVADASVFVWQAHWTAEYFGAPRSYFQKGDVTLVR